MNLFRQLFLAIFISSFICDENEGNLNASIHDFPWLVSIQFDFFVTRHVCGGVIVSNTFVLTAASCFDEGLNLIGLFLVHAGIDNIYDASNRDRQILTISQITVHPNYTSETFLNNLALVRVSSPFNLVSSIISLSNVTSFENMNLLTIGWNHVIDPLNSHVPMTLLRQTMVRESIQCAVNPIFNSETQLCTVGHCQNNSGGPVMIYSNHTKQYELVAITSFRNACTSEGIFTRTMPYFDWISEVLKNSSSMAFTIFSSSPTTTLISEPDVLGPPISFECKSSSGCGCSSTFVIFHDEPSFSTPVYRSIKGRIVGGENAQTHSWSWIVSLRKRNQHFCGGSLLNEEWVLTAAHCITDIEEMTVHIGVHRRTSFGSQTRSINRVIIHPEYKSAPDRVNDIALFRLSAPVNFTMNHVGRACLPQKSVSSDYPIVGTNLAVIGWGRLRHNGPEPEVLRQVRVKRISNDDERCLRTITDKHKQFCAMIDGGGKDSCQGDSGGPIHQWINDHWVQVGIVSFGKDCGSTDYPGVYTKLSAYYSWLESLENQTGLIIFESITMPNSSEIFSTTRCIQTNFISMTLFLLIYFLTA